jgi:hypothetical protein
MMFKKGIVFLLFCCLLNTVTALPARCCVHGAHDCIDDNKAHSLTIVEYFIKNVLGVNDTTGGIDDDFHTGVYSIEQRVTINQIIPALASAAGTCAKPLACGTKLPLPHNPGLFLLPQHYGYLFRLTPF